MNIIDRARKLRTVIESLANTLDDETALDNIELFSYWTPNHDYVNNDKVVYNDILYKVIQSHTSISSWTPDYSPSLFSKVLIPDPDVVPEWIQPDSTNAYMAGDIVLHNGVKWESYVDNNVWEPGVYGWNEVI